MLKRLKYYRRVCLLEGEPEGGVCGTTVHMAMRMGPAPGSSKVLICGADCGERKCSGAALALLALHTIGVCILRISRAFVYRVLRHAGNLLLAALPAHATFTCPTKMR